MSTVLSETEPAASAARWKPIVLKGVMQAPVTPLKDDFSFDGGGFAKMVDFHVRHGAPAIAWPHHKAESLNLTIAERKLGAEIARYRAPCAKNRRRRDSHHLSVLPPPVAGRDLRFHRADRNGDRSAGPHL